MSKTIGMKLKSLRVQNELTQTEVAKHLNMSDKSISRFELDRIKPSYTTLLAFSKYYAVPLAYLIGEDASFRQSKVDELIDELIKDGTIQSGKDINGSIADMILNAIKIDTDMRLNKKSKG